MRFTPCKAEQPQRDMKLQGQEILKAIQIMDQRKTFYRQRVSGSTCANKETVDITSLEHIEMVTEKSRNLSG